MKKKSEKQMSIASKNVNAIDKTRQQLQGNVKQQHRGDSKSKMVIKPKHEFLVGR